MKSKFFVLFVLAAFFASCQSGKNEPASRSMKGTSWAYESVQKLSYETNYYYYVWEFTSETTAKEYWYCCDNKRVDIANGEHPSKYVQPANDYNDVTIHFSCDYPDIDVYESITYHYTGATENHTRDCSGNFVTDNLFTLTFPKTGITRKFYRVKK